MALPDISNLTHSEIRQLINSLNQRSNELAQQEQTNKAAAKQALTTALQQLNALIGDGTTTPGVTNYVGVQLFSDSVIKDNLVVAVRLILQGAELQARITRNIVTVLNTTQ